jgi:hypothetical protein
MRTKLSNETLTATIHDADYGGSKAATECGIFHVYIFIYIPAEAFGFFG